MAIQFHIPRQSDRSIVTALGKIKTTLHPLIPLNIIITVPRSGERDVTSNTPETISSLAYIFEAGTEVIEHFYVRDQSNRPVLSIARKMETLRDGVTIHDEWSSPLADSNRSQLWVAVMAAARKELRAADLEAAFKGAEDSAWNSYRDAQAQVVNSLQQTTENLLDTIAKQKVQLDKEREDKYTNLEQELRQDIAKQRTTLESHFADRRNELDIREKAIADREAAFQTKEARYVARQEIKEQMKKLETWIENWKLTEGTSKKRRWVSGAYLTAITATGFLTVYTTVQNYHVLSSADAIIKLTWQHWVGLGLKSMFPFAAFTTFLIYFIRWSSFWARQHADEEFRNRSRLIDIGRASWILETIHDAQEHDKDIPVDLLKELSRNIFISNPTGDLETQPQSAAEALLQGLSSLRVKSPDGTEVEAKRENSKK